MSVGKLTAREIKRIESLIAAYEQAGEDLTAALQDVLDEWQSDFEQKSETWQDGDRGTEARDRIDRLQELVDQLAPDDPISLDDLAEDLP